MSEMVDNARRIARACALPVIADADTGFGNAINVVRTVQEYEQAGVAGAAHRRPGGAQAVRSHGGQAGRPDRRDAHQDPRRGRGPGVARPRDHRPNGRARRRGPCRGDRTGPVAIGTRAPTSSSSRRRRARPRSRPSRPSWPTYPCCSTGPKAARRRRSRTTVSKRSASPSSSSRSARLLTATASIRQALAEIAAARTPIPIMDRIPRFAEFLDFIGLPEMDELGRRFLAPD